MSRYRYNQRRTVPVLYLQYRTVCSKRNTFCASSFLLRTGTCLPQSPTPSSFHIPLLLPPTFPTPPPLPLPLPFFFLSYFPLFIPSPSEHCFLKFDQNHISSNVPYCHFKNMLMLGMKNWRRPGTSWTSTGERNSPPLEMRTCSSSPRLVMNNIFRSKKHASV